MKKILTMLMGASAAAYGATAFFEWNWAVDKSAMGSDVFHMAQWADSANWGAESGYPNSGLDHASIGNGFNSGWQYIQLPDNLTMGFISSLGCNTVLVGKNLTMDSTQVTGDLSWGAGRIREYNRIYVYADVLAPNNTSGAGHICGDYTVNDTLTLSISALNHRADLYANSADLVRRPVNVNFINEGSGVLICYGARAMEAQVRKFALTEGSAYLVVADANNALTLAAGAPVSGEGIAEGTFVKRIFTASIIELSQPVSVTAAESDVSFAAHAPSVIDTIDTFYYNGGNPDQYFVTAQYPGAPLEVDVSVFKSSNVDKIFTVYRPDNMQSGKITLHDTSGWYAPLMFRTAHLNFPGDVETTVFPRTKYITTQVNHTLTLTATNDLAITVASVVTNISSTVVKDGTGSIALTMQPGAATTGAFNIQEGTLILNGESTLANITIANGAALKITSGRFVANAFAADANASIDVAEGAELVVPFGSVLPANVTGAGTITHAIASTVNYAPLLDTTIDGKVVGTPALWMDANDLVGTVEEGGNVTRWNDHRGDGYPYATNMIAAPTLVNTTTKPYVRMAPLSTKAVEYCQSLVWDKPIKNIRAVFIAQDMADGGGSILGTSTRMDKQYFLRGGVSNAQIIYNDRNQVGTLLDSILYVDGIATNHFYNPYSAGNRGQTVFNLQVVVDGSHADAFAMCNRSDNTRWDLAGGTRLYEVLVYTNELTYAESVQVSEYLSRKWLDKGIYYERFDVRQKNAPINCTGTLNTGVNVAQDKSTVLPAVTGSGIMEKNGAGTLYVMDHTEGALKVNEGTLAITSIEPTLASDAYLHLDANADDTLTIVNGHVIKWKDCTTGNITAALRSAGSTNGPTVRTVAALNNLKTLDFGAAKYGTASCADRDDNPTLKFTGSRELKTIFTIIGSANGGNALLGGTSGRNDNPDDGKYIGLWRDVQTYVGEKDDVAARIARPLIESTTKGNWRNLSSTEVRKNTVVVNQTQEPMSGGYDLYSVRTSVHMSSDLIGGIHYGGAWGGVEHGELAYYTRYLNEEEMGRTESYFMKKWFGQAQSGYRPAAATSVAVAPQATLQVIGGAPLTFTELCLGGTAVGDLTANSGYTLCANVNDAHSLDAMTIDGTLTLAGDGILRIVGNIKDVSTGSYTLLTATNIVGAGALTCELATPCSSRNVSARVVGNSVVVTVANPAMVIIVR